MQSATPLTYSEIKDIKGSDLVMKETDVKDGAAILGDSTS